MNNKLLKLSLVLAAMVGAGCSGGQKQSLSQVQAVQGIPNIYPGIVSTDMTKLSFYEVDPTTGRNVIDTATGQPKIRHVVSMSFQGTNLVVKHANGDAIGPALSPNPHVTFSFITNIGSLWTCGAAEAFVGRSIALESHELEESASCYLELNTTGDNGFNISIVGMKDGKGLTEWLNNNKPALAAGSLRKIEDGNLTPGMVNVEIDQDGVLSAMEALTAEYQQNSGTNAMARNTCLKNQRAYGWTDIQAHYYCQLPLSPQRECYARTLIDTAGAQARGTLALDSLKDTICAVDDLAQVNPFCVAYTTCLKSTPFFQDTRRDAEFRYIMFTRQGLMDFSIESENEVINKFYGLANTTDTSELSKRPRRLLDPMPSWLPDQPRYNKIRQMQRAMQEKLGIAP